MSRFVLRCALGAAVFLACGAGAAKASVLHAPAADTRCVPKVGAAEKSVQLADEITRRLRRMHVPVLLEVDLRPYDPEGTLC